MSQNSKALAKLGLSTELLLEAFLGSQPTSREDLTRQEHSVFWSAFSPPNSDKAIEKSVQMFFKEVLITLLDVLDVAREIRVPTQSLINTLNFMQFFMDIKVDANIQKLLKRYQDNKAKYSRVCPQGDEVMRTLSKRLVDGDSALDSLIVQCTTLHSMDDFVRLTDVMSFPTMTDEDNRVTGEMAFNYAHLRKWIGHASDRQRQLFDSLLLKMRTLPQQMKMSPKLSETALLASLHILKQNLSAAPISDSNFAQSLIPALEQFLLWPQPCGPEARKLLNAMKLEALAPGHAIRARTKAECALLAFRSPRMLDTSDNVHSASDAVDPAGERAVPLFYFMDAGSPEAAHWAGLLQLEGLPVLIQEAESRLQPAQFACTADDGDHLSEEQRSGMAAHPYASLYANRPLALTAVQMRLQIAQLLSADGICPTGDKTSEMAMRAQLRKLSVAQLAAAHARLSAAADASLSCTNSADARAARASELSAVYQSLWAAGQAEITADDEFINETEAAQSFTPALHVGMPIPFGVDSAAFTFASTEMVMQIGFCPLPHTPAYDELVTLAEMHAAAATESNPAEIHIVIAGSSKVLHAVAVAYLALTTRNHDLMRVLRFRFYAVPFASLPLAGYLARHDSWYNRHMLIPFRAPFFILPRARVAAEPNFTIDMTHPLSKSAAFLRKTVEQYTREADCTLDCTIFQMCGNFLAPTTDEARRKQATLGDTPDQILPFLQRLEVGNPARAAGQSNSTTVLPSFRVKYHAVDLTGRSLGEIVDDQVTFQHIVLSHIPAQGGDVCHPANPALPVLEFYGLMSEYSKIKVKNRVIRAHVTKVEILSQDPTQLVVVVVDGTICGPYFSVNVSPFKVDDQVATLPIASFFPIKP